MDNPFSLREELGKLMWNQAGLVRNGEKLQAALNTIRELTERVGQMSVKGTRAFNLGWQQALDLRNLLLASDLIARGALLRAESRGAHYREDFPDTDDVHWLRNLYLAQAADGVKHWSEAVKLERLRA